MNGTRMQNIKTDTITERLWIARFTTNDLLLRLGVIACAIYLLMTLWLLVVPSP